MGGGRPVVATGGEQHGLAERHGAQGRRIRPAELQRTADERQLVDAVACELLQVDDLEDQLASGTTSAWTRSTVTARAFSQPATWTWG